MVGDTSSTPAPMPYCANSLPTVIDVKVSKSISDGITRAQVMELLN